MSLQVVKNFARAAYMILNIFVVIGCIVISFKGFPFALVSLLGYFIMMTAVGTLLGVWFNPGVEHKSGLTKVLTTLMGVLLIYFGDWVIAKGGVVAFQVTGDTSGASSRISLGMVSWITGILAAVIGTHKDDSRS